MWVLIFVGMSASNGGLTSLSTDFTSKEACFAAKAAVEQSKKNGVLVQVIVCAKK